MGAPRQGELILDSQGITMECVDDMEEYSHFWILFEIHANTDYFGTNNKKKTKIQHPCCPNKMGMLAT